MVHRYRRQRDDSPQECSGQRGNQIGEYIPGETQSFATYVYAASASASPWVDYFAAGPSATDALGNILYISFTEFTYDDEEYVTTYDLTPKTSADSQTILATGPFATA